MARKKLEISEKEKALEQGKKRQHKLNSIKTDFEAGKIKSFDQIFAVMAEYQLARELGLGFTTFRSRVNNTGEFTLNNIRKLADIIGIEESVVTNFFRELMEQIPKTKSTSK